MTRIALLQMTSGIDPAGNAATVVDAVERAHAEGAAMVFTPEMSGLIDRAVEAQIDTDTDWGRPVRGHLA